jgi:hypothetical protein
MSSPICELKASRGGSVGGTNPRRELIYAVRGTEDVAAIEALIELTAPASFRGLVLQDYEIALKGSGLSIVTVQYGKQVLHSPRFTFDTGDGTKHITQSLKTMGKFAPPGQIAEDYQGAIGVDENGVKGVDVPDGVFAFTEKHVYPIARITPEYVGKLFRLRGKKNKEAWTSTPMAPGGLGYEFAAGEARFRKATGGNIDDEFFEVTYHFEGSPNATGLAVGTITGITKRGWDYLWIRYRDAVDSNRRVKVPGAAYVEEVCEDGDFGDLLFGEVFSVVLLASGFGYTGPPVVTIAPPEDGTQAAAAAILNDVGEIVKILIVDSGSGYKTVPAVTIVGEHLGDAAMAVAVIG